MAVNAVAKSVQADERPHPGRQSDALYRPEPYFALRTPAYPVSRWQAVLDASIDQGSLVRHLKRAWEDAWVEEAVYLASPSLHRRLSDWSWRLDSQKDRKLLRAFYSYFSRMCTRSTPFGLFSANGTGEVGGQSSLSIGLDREHLRRHTQLDVTALTALAGQLSNDPETRKKLYLRLNDCGYESGSRWQYVEWSLIRGVRTYALSAVELNPPLEQVLELLQSGSLRFVDLIDRFCEAQTQFSRGDVEEFVSSLIDHGLLLVSLEPQLTGDQRLPAMLDSLRCADPGLAIIGQLDELNQSLARLDRQGPGADTSDYDSLEVAVRAMGAKVDRKRLFQVDMHRSGKQLRISTALAAEIAEAAELRLRLFARRNDDLDEFCRQFNQRFEGRRIPLLEALDEETGIGEGRWTDVPSVLLDRVQWVAGAGSASRSIEALLLAESLDHAGEPRGEICIDPANIPEPDPDLLATLPDAIATMTTLIGPSIEAIEQGQGQIWMQGIMGTIMANMTGRFCQGDSRLTEHVRAGLAREAQLQPDAIFAEIVHLPQEKYGNLVSRPLLRDYEIPVLGRSGAPEDRQIHLRDLEIEVQGTRITLWSKRLKRRVIPRMSAAHNYDGNTLGIYRFLCRLQHHGLSGRHADVSSLFGQLERVPRISCGRIILFPARWNLDRKRVEGLIRARPEQQMQQLEVLRGELALPRWVGIAEGDNILALDLTSPLAAEILVAEFNKVDRLQLEELYLDPDQLCVGQGDQRYVHELVLPMIRAREAMAAADDEKAGVDRLPGRNIERFLARPAQALSRASERERIRLPGSEWLSYRLFGGTVLLDRALAETMTLHAEQWRNAGWCRDWFFIRYHDPSPHLRVRFFGDPKHLTQQVLPAMHQLADRLVHQRMIDNLEIASYQRELERYGGPVAMAHCERWFAQDSRRIGALLGLVRNGNPDWRWQLAAVGLVRDLTDFGLGADDLLALFEVTSDGFRREFRMEKGRLASLGRKYRDLTQEVCTACSGSLPGDLATLSEIPMILETDRELRRDIGNELRKLSASGQLHGSVESLLPSFVHMSCNRWFVDRPRANEMVLYDLIRRGLTALRAQRLGPWDPARSAQRFEDEMPSGNGSTRSPVVT